MGRVPFKAFPKIARLRRTVIITEKLDGTNAQVRISADGEVSEYEPEFDTVVCTPPHVHNVRAGSRTRWLSPESKESDNLGFAAWVRDNATTLVADLGEGVHYGEWWGRKIQRAYGLDVRRFSLFNTILWNYDGLGSWRGRQSADRQFLTPNLSVVPLLPWGSLDSVEAAVDYLRMYGSVAAPGFMDPEGVVVFHPASGTSFKQTLVKDEDPKGVGK